MIDLPTSATDHETKEVYHDKEERSTTANRNEDAPSIGICLLCYGDLEEGTVSAAEAVSEVETEAEAEQGNDLEEVDVDLEIGKRISTATTTTAAAGSTRVDLVPCGHSYCLDCLDEYFKYSISIHEVPIPCPSIGSTTSCDQYVPPDIVRHVFMLARSPSTCTTSPTHHGGEYWIRKYTHLDRLAHDPSLVPCPRCDELVSTTTLSSSPTASPLSSPTESENNKTMVLVCPNVDCQHEFCSLHGDLHLGRSCSEYEAEQQEHVVQQQRHEELVYLQQVIVFKPCSHCGMGLCKDDGCDHVICPACHQDMCYECGTHLYLSGRVLRSCSKCQRSYVDHRHQREHAIRWHLNFFFCYRLPPFAFAFFVAVVIYQSVKSQIHT